MADAVVETALTSMREKLMALGSEQVGIATVDREGRQLLTVIFADISDFTARAGKLDGEDVQDLIRQLWDRLDHVILEHGGQIEKHL